MTQAPAAVGVDPTKATLSVPEIWALIDARPWPGDAKLIGLGVVLAESGGKTNARNTNADGSVDRGMWQFNNRAHPEVSDSCADNPECATQHAYETWQASGRSFRQWATFNSGAYKKPLSDFNVISKVPGAHSDPLPGPVKDAAGAVKDAVNSVPDFLHHLGVIFDPAWWVRVAKVLFGAAAIIGGVVYIGKSFAITEVAGSALKGLKGTVNGGE